MGNDTESLVGAFDRRTNTGEGKENGMEGVENGMGAEPFECSDTMHGRPTGSIIGKEDARVPEHHGDGESLQYHSGDMDCEEGGGATAFP